MELPYVQKIYEKYSDQGFQVVAIEINNDRKGAEKFIKENGLTFIFSEADRKFVKDYFNTAIYPNSFIIGKDSRIKQHHIGFKKGDEVKLEKEILAELNAE